MPISHYEIEFTKDGAVHDNAQVAKVLDDLAGVTDLLVVSHGWNNNIQEARQLYDKLSENLERILGANLVSGLQGRSFAMVRLFWPSKKFTDADLIPGGGAASATQENDDALIRVLEEMKIDPHRLGGQEINTVRAAILTQAQQLVPKLESDPQARRDYVQLLRSVLDPSAAGPDDASEEFFTGDPENVFKQLEQPVVVAGAAGGGGASSVGGAAGFIGDALKGVKAAARRIANFATYYQMKTRAGTVGTVGLAPLLQRFRNHKNDLRLHLVGHSFGGRLVTAAAASQPPGTSALSLTLLQAAYSHNGLASQFDNKHDGAFRSLLADQRASGPVIITHTKNDRAVGIAYPLASRLSRDQASALGDKDDPYGGMGRNGAQHTPEVADPNGKLLDLGGQYRFVTGSVFNLQADEFIADHSDVTGLQVAYALLNAVGATS